MSAAADEYPARGGMGVYEGGVSITPHDDNQLARVSKGLFVGPNGGGAGNLAVMWRDGTTTTLTALPPGVYPFRVRKVLSTGTTATGIVALY